MKKILSLCLAALLLVSAVPMVYAAETTAASNGTTITATGTKGAAYEVTVPAVLAPGQSGTVTASGTWAANQTLKVTAPTSVDLVNGSDKIPVGIEFAGIQEVGNNNGDAEYATATVTVGNVDTSAFFGTWTGTLNYTVEMVRNDLISITIYEDDGTAVYQMESGMTLAEWIDSDYNTAGYYYDGSYIVNSDHTFRLVYIGSQDYAQLDMIPTDMDSFELEYP